MSVKICVMMGVGYSPSASHGRVSPTMANVSWLTVPPATPNAPLLPPEPLAALVVVLVPLLVVPAAVVVVVAEQLDGGATHVSLESSQYQPP